MTTRAAPAISTRARTALSVNAAVAWGGVLVTVALSGLGWFDRVQVDPGLYGDTAEGWAGAASRLSDTFSYFTNWSNIAVAVSR